MFNFTLIGYIPPLSLKLHQHGLSWMLSKNGKNHRLNSSKPPQLPYESAPSIGF